MWHNPYNFLHYVHQSSEDGLPQETDHMALEKGLYTEKTFSQFNWEN